MKILLLGSLGNINRYMIPKLIANGHEVTVITTNADRLTAISELGAKGVVGDMKDQKFLTEQLKGKDLAYLMIAPTTLGVDLYQAAITQANVFVQAIIDSGIKNVINLSSIGADEGPEIGILHAYNLIENTLNKLTNINIAFVRPTEFYNNLYEHLQTIKTDHKIFSNIDGDFKTFFVDPIDIATTLVSLIENFPAGHTIHYVVSDEFSINDFVVELKKVLAWDDIQLILLNDQEYKGALLKNNIPGPIIDAFIKMNEFKRHPEQIKKELLKYNTKFGKIKLNDFVNKFVKAIDSDSKNSPRAQTVVS